MRFAEEAWPFVLPFLILGSIFAYLGWLVWTAVALLLGCLILLFFRDPSRRFDGGPEAILAPADGVVLAVDEIEEPALGEGRFQRIITFLSVFDVHVQRVPTDGRVVSSRLIRGRKVAAFKEGADEVNEKHLTVLERPGGERVGIQQVVGLVARRIVCYLQEDQAVQRGQSLGLIKFGSRVDLILPLEYNVQVAKGDRMRNGETVAALASGRPEPTP